MVIKQLYKKSIWMFLVSYNTSKRIQVVEKLLDNNVEGYLSTIYINVDFKTGDCEFVYGWNYGKDILVENMKITASNRSASKTFLIIIIF